MFKINTIFVIIVIKTMPRHKHQRNIVSPPIMLGFKPFGIPSKSLETIYLHYDEYEALRLLDYKGLNQENASKQMEISRPTLTRIYELARKKIACAFVEGKAIRIEGGEVEFEKNWFRCKHCHCLKTENEPHVNCPKNNTEKKCEFESVHGHE
jgi:uncharacterized protein